MTNPLRPLATALAVALLAVSGCASTTAGSAVGDIAGGGTTTAPPSSPTEPCDDVIHGDPWVAFESPLADGADLTVGGRGWLSGSGADDIDVSGDVDAVRLTDESAATEIRCGTATSWFSWIEVTATGAGTAVLTFPTGDTISVHVTDR